VLASASPRRRAQLARSGVAFQIDVPTVDEALQAGESGPALAQRLARAKALAVAARHRGAVVVAADTVVALDARPLGKPRDAADAWAMLRALRGRWHQVITAVCVMAPEAGMRLGTLTTAVEMRSYTDAEIAAYIARGEPFDKAGAYAIQDPAFQPVARWRGCYTNVVGLPLCLTAALLSSAGVELPPSLPAAADRT
jgi:MAF protein